MVRLYTEGQEWGGGGSQRAGIPKVLEHCSIVLMLGGSRCLREREYILL